MPFKGDLALAAFKVESLLDLFHSLIDRVFDLCKINLRDNIKCVLLRHSKL